MLCRANPSRICTRNLRPKYLIDDHLKAKCGAAVRVELVDDRDERVLPAQLGVACVEVRAVCIRSESLLAWHCDRHVSSG